MRNPSSPDYDVIIVGAGPSGIFTAYRDPKEQFRCSRADDREGEIHRKTQMPQTHNRRLCQLPALCPHDRVFRRRQL